MSKLTDFTAKPATLLSVLQTLKEGGFEQLSDLACVDYSTYKGTVFKPQDRFLFVYHLLNLSENKRVCVRVWRSSESAETPFPSASTLYPCATWFEREIWDLFGMTFEGSGYEPRLLLDETFEGHPLRKDFPVMGKTELFYSPKEGKITSRPTGSLHVPLGS